MSELSAGAKQKVLELKLAYISSFPGKIKQLEECWQSILSSQFAESELGVMRAVCHKLAGSSGSYELLDISRAAHDLEQLCVNEKSNSHEDAPELGIESSYHALMKLMQQRA